MIQDETGIRPLAEGLSRLSDEMRTIAVEEVKKSLRKVFKEQLPDANVNVDD
jgi:hypothetical protein